MSSRRQNEAATIILRRSNICSLDKWRAHLNAKIKRIGSERVKIFHQRNTQRHVGKQAQTTSLDVPLQAISHERSKHIVDHASQHLAEHQALDGAFEDMKCLNDP